MFKKLVSSIIFVRCLQSEPFTVKKQQQQGGRGVGESVRRSSFL